MLCDETESIDKAENLDLRGARPSFKRLFVQQRARCFFANTNNQHKPQPHTCKGASRPVTYG
ncbi:hypothetical protein CKA38_00255 [Ereboglobus luteus]|uniref:Uncharacterized protein n=1 Tax=Ereboglobus luteus TaxID=1796921 RepID=A0A2U8DZ43_9BACT|nr:hypothetical protein CKA38_00255 [Ereboglobus luteus]